MGFDVIGDVHGHADELEALLTKLGYAKNSGAWSCSDRHLVFVGDLIDRGPDQLKVVDIARRMRDAGAASVCMGNHEFNAIGWMTEDADKPGRFYRDRSDEDHQRQHREFLDQVGAYSARHTDLIEWFKSLPLWLDFPGFRVVHACWHQPSMTALASCLTPNMALSNEGIRAVFTNGTDEYRAAEIVLKGPEVSLPSGKFFLDKGGKRRTEARVQWWNDSARTYRTSALGVDDIRDSLPDDELPLDAFVRYDFAKPVFFGHYWLREDEPKLVCDMRACLDYSIAKDGQLVAYRWDGEERLDPTKLISVGRGHEQANFKANVISGRVL